MGKKEECKNEIVKECIAAISFTLSLFVLIYILSGFVSKNYEYVNALEESEKIQNTFEDKIESQTEIQKYNVIAYNDKLINDKFISNEKMKEEKITIKDGLIINSPIDSLENKKIAYLTFDDGPSQGTIKILNILKEQNIKATFFVIGEMAKNNKDIILREKSEGHSVENHTYSHNYNYLYASPDNLLSDIKANEALLQNIIGDYKSNIVRFPGGSFGKNKSFIEELNGNNYRYVDWNCLTGDADAPLVSKEKLVENFKKSFNNQKSLVVLMHDMPGKTTTIDALPNIIGILKSNGYEFRPIN